MDIHIELARLDDVPALISLLTDLFSIEQDFRPEPDKQERGLQALLAREDSARIHVIRSSQGAVIGMVSAQLVISTAEGAASVWIEDLVLDQAWRGQGLGRRLLASILDWAWEKGTTRAQLLADMGNTPALAFYDHLGWQPTQLRAYRMSGRLP